MRAIEPDDFLEDYPPPMAAIAQVLRDIVRSTFPDAVERVRAGWHLIGYDVPTGRPGRPTAYAAYIAPEVEHVHLGFEHGWAMHDPEQVLQGAGITRQVRWLTFVPGDEIDAERCATLLREAARVAIDRVPGTARRAGRPAPRTGR